MSHRIHRDLGVALQGAGVVADPGTGNTVDLGSRSLATCRGFGAGTYKLPSLPDDQIGCLVSVVADASQTWQNAAGTTLLIMASGTTAIFEYSAASTWVVLAYSGNVNGGTGFIDLPLVGWREVTSNDITNAAGNGGVLATDTTPTLETVNGDTDGQIRMLWAASNSDAIARQVTLPPDLDRTAPIVVYIRGNMSGAIDAGVIDADTFFDEGDTKVEDATGDWDNSGPTNRTITIAAADIPDTATTMSIELTPAAHTTDTMTVYATWIQYTKKYVG